MTDPYEHIPPDETDRATSAYLPSDNDIMSARREVDEVGFPGYDGNWRKAHKCGLPADRDDEESADE